MLVCHRINGVQDHAESLLMAVSLAERGRPVLVETHMWLAGAKNRHIREGHAHQAIIRK